MDGLYLSFETRTGEQQLQDALPGSTLDRLRTLKSVYDPEQVFHSSFPIAPSAPDSS
ncbi:BBE domain-containing protein [Qaidamihabitans albus]|uniref:BBE domain-containing protein n=1 Tax=Qaidamihabitans albus TaxID=2795733 RepID=UPI0035591282